jgi:hypothetical protein
LPENLVDFRWCAPQYGFEWVETSLQGAQQPCLVERGVPPDDISIARTPAAKAGTEKASARDSFLGPLNITGLHRIFADTEPTLEGIQQFANRYGRLGVDFRGPLDNPRTKLSRDRPGETFELWAREILGMKHAVEFWERIRAGDVRSLSRFIREFPADHAVIVRYVGPETPIGPLDRLKRLFKLDR